MSTIKIKGAGLSIASTWVRGEAAKILDYFSNGKRSESTIHAVKRKKTKPIKAGVAGKRANSKNITAAIQPPRLPNNSNSKIRLLALPIDFKHFFSMRQSYPRAKKPRES